MSKPIRVLIVEDSEDDALLLLRELRRGGYDPTSTRVDTLDDMRLSLSEQIWDIALIDHVMPQFSGPAALALLQDSELDLPSIIVSGVIGEDAAVDAMRAGARDYILKERLSRLVPAIERELNELERRKEHRRTQEELLQSQKMETVGRLAGGIAHDFNNMLTAIMGYTYAGMKDPTFSGLQHNYFEEIQKAAERAASLTQQLLAFSRRQIIEPQIVDLNHLIVYTSKMLRSVINENIELVTLLDPNLYKVKVDPDQMGQALINLATNARDAMPNGGKFTVATRNVTLAQRWNEQGSDIVAGDYVALTVSDNGIGMTPYVKEHLFEPFFTTKEVGKGTGLGLATCYGIAKQNGGRIEVCSDPALGTTFQIHLPRAVEEEMDTPPNDESVRLLPGTETVLIVEDEPSVRNMVVRILHEQGYKVLQAANGEEALRVVNTHADEAIHLLFTDMVMPQMGGKELVEHLKLVRPGTKVLLTSGYTNEVVAEDGKLADDIPFLQKPFLPTELVRKVQEVLSS